MSINNRILRVAAPLAATISLFLAAQCIAQNNPAAMNSGPANNAPTRTPQKLDLTFVPADAVAAVVGQPSHLLNGPLGTAFAPVVAATLSKQQIGFEVGDIEQTMVVVGQENGLFRHAVVLRFSKPIAAAVATALAPNATEVQIAGHKSRVAAQGGPSCVIVDDQTLVLSHQPDLEWVLAAKPGDSALQKLMAVGNDAPCIQAFLAVEPLRPMFAQHFAQAQAAGKIPPQLAVYTKLPDLIDTITMSASLSPSSGLQFQTVINSPNQQAAQEVETDVKQLLEMGKMIFLAQLAGAKAPPMLDFKGMADKVVSALQPTQAANRVEIHAEMQSAPAAVGMAVALILPAIQAGREAATRNQSSNNLKQIALALLNYEAAHKVFPAQAKYDNDGKPLLSWRVGILPYIEEQQLYQQFHLDEPWDSPNNIKLLDKMPAVFKHPKVNKPGMTVYQGVYGKGCALEGKAGNKIQSFTDGTSKTIMVVETSPAVAVPWTKPDDWQFDEKQPTHDLGGLLAGDIFNVVFADGHVQAIAKSINPDTFKAMLTRNGGEPIPNN